MTSFMQDVRYALRQLRRAPGFAVTAVLTLALGIGVTVTVMALVQQVLLAPLPYPEPNRIVAVEFHWPSQEPSESTTGPAGKFVMQHARSFAVAAFVGAVQNANLSIAGGHATSIPVSGVSRGYFNVLGVQPALGRSFTAKEDMPDGPPAVVLSYGLWKTALGGDPAVVGRAIHLNGKSVLVVGVMPEGFHAAGEGVDEKQATPVAWTTLQAGPSDPGYEYNNYDMIARLRAGVTVTQAQAELSALQKQLYRADPSYNKVLTGMRSTRTYQVWPYAAVVASQIRPSLLVMSWAALAVLLLTCLNLAGLNLSRALHRAPEFSLRLALGAARTRLLRLALVEVGVLAFSGSVGAVILSRALLLFLLRSSPVPIPQLSSGSGVAALAGMALMLGVVCALLFGAPFTAIATWQRGNSSGMSQRSAGTSRGQVRAGRTIVAGQVALSLVLLSVATLLLGTFLKLKAEPLGFNPEKLVMFQTSLKGEHYATTQATSAFAAQVVANLRNTPGVSSAAASVGLPLKRGLNEEGWASAHPQQGRTIQVRTVTPGFLQTLGSNLLAGRSLTQSDSAGGQQVALVSAAASRQFWPGRSAIGEMLNVGDGKANMYRVIGIVQDSPADQLGQAPDLMVYMPMAQQSDKTTSMMSAWFPLSFVVRMAGSQDTAAIALRAVASVDPTIPVTGLTTMRAVVDESVAAPRFFLQVTEAFAAFALLLTALGIFGLLSYQVTRRTREIGVRMALGASRARILRGVLRTSATMCLLGSLVGGAAAFLLHPVLTRWIVRYVAGIDPTQTQYLVSGATGTAAALLLLALASFAAAMLPARRAARVEPMESLRAEG